MTVRQSETPTPGPWKIARMMKKRGLTLSDALFIETENPLPGHGETICRLGAGIVHFANSEANGRLIAASPTLLEAAAASIEAIKQGEADIALIYLRHAIDQAVEGGAS